MEKPNDNIQALRKYLMSQHDDGDDDSMYMKFASVLDYIDRLESDLRGFKSVAKILSKRRKESLVPREE